MNMKEFSLQTGLSAHTLRYYEKIGLLKNVQRNASGHRVYTAREREWVGFIVRLKSTGMPLEQIQRYAELRERGEKTMQARQQLLEQHRRELQQHIDEQLEHLDALEVKIQFYRDKLSS
ncbi:MULTISPECIES: MerR family transcriptional regulator [Vibrio]|uniref:Putative MerR family transcriptional regulator n=1 Tax=Vibrio proteolyticus NBRC 13287 TaxID=1219065 RepID=U3BKI1_VIBPR|nr:MULTISPECIES: MerR family transcriptional regulator [Vibrio]NAW60089.1 MerR family transcriptional regulator [Vibrio sp. V36_P2S2PM302]NAX22142.1 MerR family transcriptional regulator [Vibrio sp. V39_P1S14PM300]NAX25297.1 MerR family transcriptional regulator [Vibrio sp. V38_P2S17PM301]NAX30044.1 MerR family transcriptional regulator [Vibrio sp. V37_P2S8PM304]GAD67133.1 putative MerR family transcriptional regulator [Vibrio proteolyticus NBRC 13287]